MLRPQHFFSWLVDKIRHARYALSTHVRLLNYGAIYKTSYRNWKHDYSPLIFIMYSGPKYTHGLNINYMNRNDRIFFARLIYMIRRGGQIIDGYTLYKLLKQQRMSIIKTCYRLYFTNMIKGKLVSAGITSLDRLIYTGHHDPWIAALNNMIAPTSVEGLPRIAYSPTELQERIVSAATSTDIRKRTVGVGSPLTRPAPWIRQ